MKLRKCLSKSRDFPFHLLFLREIFFSTERKERDELFDKKKKLSFTFTKKK